MILTRVKSSLACLPPRSAPSDLGIPSPHSRFMKYDPWSPSPAKRIAITYLDLSRKRDPEAQWRALSFPFSAARVNAKADPSPEAS